MIKTYNFKFADIGSGFPVVGPTVVEAERWDCVSGIEGPTIGVPPEWAIRRWFHRGWWVVVFNNTWQRLYPGEWIVKYPTHENMEILSPDMFNYLYEEQCQPCPQT